jgi:hypothetical protein
MPAKFALAALALSVLGLAAGCSRKHISPAHGLATRGAFAMQQAKPARPPPPPSMALDTQEADVIARSYVKSLSGKKDAAEPDPVVYLSTQRPAPPVRLAPSVPKE